MVESPTITIRVTPELERKLRERVEKEGRSVSEFVRAALEVALTADITSSPTSWEEVYWKVNGETKVDTPLRRLYDACEGEKETIASFVGRIDPPYGEERCWLIKLHNLLFLECEWFPDPPYCWEERRILLFKGIL